jgi:phage baseplate assembly protein W
MPLERISKGFKDLSMSFQISPLNNDLIAIRNETAIARSIRNIVLTQPGERFFNNEFGSSVSNSLFENMSDISADTIKGQIRSSISRFEPRVELIDVQVVPNYSTLEFDVSVTYKIIGIDALPQQLSFALEQTR